MNFIGTDDLKRLEELSHKAFEYVIERTINGRTEDIGYCNSADNPVELVKELNNISDDSSFYLFTVNPEYTPQAAMEYTSRLIRLTKTATSSLFSSLSNSEFAASISKF